MAIKKISEFITLNSLTDNDLLLVERDGDANSTKVSSITQLSKDYINSQNFATETYVQNQNYATQSWVNDQIGSATGGLVTPAWVNSTISAAIAPLATKDVATTSANGLMSSSDKSKLNGIANDANNYVHPTTSGNKHIPSGGSSGQILRWKADGEAQWGNDNNTTYTLSSFGITVPASKLNFTADVTSNIQAQLDGKANSSHNHSISNITDLQNQLNGKQSTITGAASTVTNSNLTTYRVLISNSEGKIDVAPHTDTTELSYLDGVTSNIQAQLDGKQATITGAASTVTGNNLTPSRVAVSNESGKLGVLTDVSTTELSYLNGATSNIQTQLNNINSLLKKISNININNFIVDFDGAPIEDKIINIPEGISSGITFMNFTAQKGAHLITFSHEVYGLIISSPSDPDDWPSSPQISGAYAFKGTSISLDDCNGRNAPMRAPAIVFWCKFSN